MLGFEGLGGVGLIVAIPRRLFWSRADSAAAASRASRVARGEAALEPERAEQDQRHREQRQRRELRGEHEEHAADQQRADEHLDQVVGAAVQEPLDLVDVLVQHGHQAAGAGLEEHVRRERWTWP